MVADEEVKIIRDLLIVREIITVIPRTSSGHWVLAMHVGEKDAADRLLAHLRTSIVLATFALRGTDHDCDDVDEHVRRRLRSHWPEVGVPLWYAGTFDPDEDVRRRSLWEIVIENAGQYSLEQDAAKLAVQRASELLADPSENVQEPAREILAIGGECRDRRYLALKVHADLAARALYTSGQRGLEACRSLLTSFTPLGVAVTAMRYMGLAIVEVTEEAKKAALESLPAPPIAIPSNARMFVSTGPSRHDDVGRLLREFAPAVKAWLDLEIRGGNFEDWDGPEILKRVRELVETLPSLQTAWKDLDVTI